LWVMVRMRRALSGEGIAIPTLAQFGHVIGGQPGAPGLAHQAAHCETISIRLQL
jgi:hypothetical protein